MAAARKSEHEAAALSASIEKEELESELARYTEMETSVHARKNSALIDYFEREGWLLKDEIESLGALRKVVDGLCVNSDTLTTSAARTAKRRSGRKQRGWGAAGKARRNRPEENLARVSSILTHALLRGQCTHDACRSEL